MDNQPSRPTNDTWVAAVHRAENDERSLGSAFVLDVHRLVTCAHVVASLVESGASPWVAFPKAEEGDTVRIRVREIVVPPPQLQSTQDVAILRLAEPIPNTRVPQLRCPTPADLVGRDWWAFGFPGGEQLGNSAAGAVGEALGYGWVRLDTRSRYVVKSGFSGSALWSPEYDAIVGMVGQAGGEGDGRALSLWKIDRIFPEEGIADLAAWSVEAAGESALASWGWSLQKDPEAGRHWRPRARGVSIETEKGFRFRGRTTALTTIVNWINRPPERRSLIVTGSPGVGKSAVLGRIVTTADREIADQLPIDDMAVRAPIGSISCAVHAKGKTALDIAVEIAAAASAALPDSVDYLPELLREAISPRLSTDKNGLGHPFNVIIDALDEAATPQQARLVIRRIVVPLVETCADLNVRVVVGSRRRDDSGDLLAAFGRALSLIDLDHPHYFDQEDLEAYTLATLQLLGDERRDNPYTDGTVAEPVARRIAEMSDRNFLIAGLVARAHGLHDKEPVRPDEIAFIPTVDGALRDYLDRIQPVDGCSAQGVLTALAFAEAPGFSIQLWRMAILAVGGSNVTDRSLAAFARSSAANFLVESGGGQGAKTVYRLFHQALNDTLISARSDLHPRREDELALTRAMIAEGKQSGWTNVDSYLKRSLPAHAEAGGAVDELLAQDEYLLHADLRRLLPVADRVDSDLVRTKAKLIRRTPQAFNADPGRRVALFSVTETEQRLGHVYRDLPASAPYRARWSTVVPGSEEAVLDGHTRWAYVLCSFSLEGQELLASAGGDRTLRIWDPILGEAVHVMEGHSDEIRSIVPVRLGTVESLATTGRDGTIRFWDPLTGEGVHIFSGDPGGYSALCSVHRSGQTLLAAARSSDAAIQLLDPESGQEVTVLDGHDQWITDLCEIIVDGLPLLASSGEDGTVRLWDLSDGTSRWVVSDDGAWDGVWIRTLCAIEVGGRTLLVGGGYDLAIQLWDPRDGTKVGLLTGHDGAVFAVCAATRDGEPVLVSGGADGTLRLWSPESMSQLAIWFGHAGAIYSVSAIGTESQLRFTSTGDDRSIRIWDPATGRQTELVENRPTQLFDDACVLRSESGLLTATRRVGDDAIDIRDPMSWEVVRRMPAEDASAMCRVTIEGQALLAVAGKRLQILDPQIGRRVRVLKYRSVPYGGVPSLCAIKVDAVPVLVASYGSSLHFWDVSREYPVHSFKVGIGAAWNICPVPVHGRLAIAGLSLNGRRVQAWNPASGDVVAELEIGRSVITSQCVVKVGDRMLLATGHDSGDIRFWDLDQEKSIAVLDGHSARVQQVWMSKIEDCAVLVSAGDDRTLRIWDLTDRRLLVDIPLHYPIEWVAQAGPYITASLNAGMIGIALASFSEAVDQDATGASKTVAMGPVRQM
ncbi:trypsin-like peptidase domain-containing protein [Streptomyces sp. NPDC002611]